LSHEALQEVFIEQVLPARHSSNPYAHENEANKHIQCLLCRGTEGHR
jgi:hypothetical protein